VYNTQKFFVIELTQRGRRTSKLYDQGSKLRSVLI